MKRRVRKIKEQIEHRGNNTDLVRQYQERMNVVRKVPETYYTSEGEIRETGSRKK